jgi:hypothetical protein
MWLMTSKGEMSAARITTPMGSVMGALAAGVGLLRRALTTSLTPRLRDLLTAAVVIVSYVIYLRSTDGGAHPSSQS